MDPRSFDAFARSLAGPKTRRGLLGGLVAFAAGVRAASATLDCPPGQTRNRKGECRCPPGTDACPGGCFDKRRDAANCGACGHDCGEGGICIKGECRCGPGFETCDSGCTDLTTDPNNCGDCGDSCGTVDDCTPPSCADGSCTFVSACTEGTYCSFGGAPDLCGPPTEACPVPSTGSSYDLTCPFASLRCTAQGTLIAADCTTGGGLSYSELIVNTCAALGFIVTNCNGVLTCGSC